MLCKHSQHFYIVSKCSKCSNEGVWTCGCVRLSASFSIAFFGNSLVAIMAGALGQYAADLMELTQLSGSTSDESGDRTPWKIGSLWKSIAFSFKALTWSLKLHNSRVKKRLLFVRPRHTLWWLHHAVCDSEFLSRMGLNQHISTSGPSKTIVLCEAERIVKLRSYACRSWPAPGLKTLAKAPRQGSQF